MEVIVYILLLSIALAMDASAVSISLGMSGLAKEFKNRIKIALTFGLYQGILFALGYLSISILGSKLSTINSYIAAVLLTVLGCKMIKEYYDEKNTTCPHNVCLGLDCSKEKCDRTGQYRVLTNRLLCFFGIATSIDSFAAGISYRLANTESYLFMSSLSIGIITFLLSFIGVTFGLKIKNIIGKYADLIGGIILLILAIKSLF